MLACVLLGFISSAKRLAGKNASEMTCSLSSGM